MQKQSLPHFVWTAPPELDTAEEKMEKWEWGGGGQQMGTNFNGKKEKKSGSKAFCVQTSGPGFRKVFVCSCKRLSVSPSPTNCLSLSWKIVVHNHVVLLWLNKALFLTSLNIAELCKCFQAVCQLLYVCVCVFCSSIFSVLYKRKLSNSINLFWVYLC